MKHKGLFSLKTKLHLNMSRFLHALQLNDKLFVIGEASNFRQPENLSALFSGKFLIKLDHFNLSLSALSYSLSSIFLAIIRSKWTEANEKTFKTSAKQKKKLFHVKIIF